MSIIPNSSGTYRWRTPSDGNTGQRVTDQEAYDRVVGVIRKWAQQPQASTPLPRSTAASANTIQPPTENLIQFPTTTTTTSEKKKTRAERHCIPKHPTKKARAALNRYLAMGPERSLRKLAEVLYPNRNTETTYSTLADWSVAYTWQQAAEEYDEAEAKRIEYERQERMRKHEEAKEAMDERQADRAVKREDQLDTLYNALLTMQLKVVSDALRDGMDPQELLSKLFFGPRLIQDGYAKAVHQERTARGTPTVISANSHELTGRNGGPIETEDAREMLMEKINAILERMRAAREAGFSVECEE